MATCLCGCKQETRTSPSGESNRYIWGHNAQDIKRQRSLFAGEKYGRLTVLDYVPGRYGRAGVRCECGAIKDVRITHLKSGDVRSCGCLRKDRTAEKQGNFKHGHSQQGRSPSYESWMAMNRRCKYEYDISYEWYGGRGISVCEQWRFGTPNAFINFLNDMGERPPGEALDRIDSDGDYTPENTRWATQTVNIHNRRNLGNYGPRKHRAS